jgi:fatty acid desaturase
MVLDISERTSAPLTGEKVAAGTFFPRLDRNLYKIPGTLNLWLSSTQFCIALTILAFCSHSTNILVQLSLAVAFAFVMQTGFCLAHEAVHRKLHPNRTVNLSFGVAMFSIFPGSFHFFEIVHLIHHRRNRSDDELEDYVLPQESAWTKRAMYYLLISGLFWLLIPLSSIAIAMIPKKRIHLAAPDEESGVFRKFAQFLNEVRPGRVRRDVLCAAVLWGLAFPLLRLRLYDVLLCYAVFAFSWASQQYIYHVRTPRHAVLGALNLRLWRPLQWLYLNFNYHLSHHLAVWVPWNHLPSIVAEQPTRGYLQTYGQLWQPPQAIEHAWPAAHQTSGPLPTRGVVHHEVELPW